MCSYGIIKFLLTCLEFAESRLARDRGQNVHKRNRVFQMNVLFGLKNEQYYFVFPRTPLFSQFNFSLNYFKHYES